MEKELNISRELTYVDELQALALAVSVGALVNSRLETTDIKDTKKAYSKVLSWLYGVGISRTSLEDENIDEVRISFLVEGSKKYAMTVRFTSEAGEEGPRFYYKDIKGSFISNGETIEPIDQYEYESISGGYIIINDNSIETSRS